MNSMMNMKRELIAGILGYTAILGFNILFWWTSAVVVAGIVAVRHSVGLFSDINNQAMVVVAGTIILFVSPVVEEVSKALAVRADFKFYPLILGGIEFLQYVLLVNGANVFVRLVTWGMHVGTGEIHRRYRKNPIKGCVWAILAHQTYNMLVMLIAYLYVKYLL